MGILITDDPMYSEKCEEYMRYLDKHINGVYEAFVRLFKNVPIENIKLDGYDDDLISRVLIKLEEDVRNHDLSKYTDIEFYPYRLNFYPTDIEKTKLAEDDEFSKKCEEEMEEAWHHHYTNNYHHPAFYKWCDVSMNDEFVGEYVVLDTPKEVADDMPLIAIYHMIADWASFENGRPKSTVEWYLEDASEEKSMMSPATKEKVEMLLSKLYNVDINVFKENNNG